MTHHLALSSAEGSNASLDELTGSLVLQGRKEVKSIVSSLLESDVFMIIMQKKRYGGCLGS